MKKTNKKELSPIQSYPRFVISEWETKTYNLLTEITNKNFKAEIVIIKILL